MIVKPRNAYYLRISTDIVLPLFLYIDERHIDWMSDVVLQHILADLRPLIIPKLQAEKDVHFGPRAAPGNKRGSVEVHRGETYQFAYFFRKTEPHIILLKSKYFVTVPLRPEVALKSVSPSLVDRSSKKRRPRTEAEESERKRAKTKETEKNLQSHFDEDEWSTEEGDEDMDGSDLVPRECHPVRKQRPIIVGSFRELDDDDVEDMRQDVVMKSPLLGRDGVGGSRVDIEDGGAVTWEVNNQPNSSPDNIQLVAEEEEKKPKPFVKLKYQSFSISGHCLCVVVEPWSPLRAETRPQSIDLGTSFQLGNLKPPLLPSNGSVAAEECVKTPLFLPEYDGTPSEAPFAQKRTLPSEPLFHEVMSKPEDGHGDDDLMNFSQTLNVAGHTYAITADDDDDMDGAVLFGDADEVRELF